MEVKRTAFMLEDTYVKLLCTVEIHQLEIIIDGFLQCTVV